MKTGTTTHSSLGRLLTALERHARLAIAASGGVDSMTLAHVAHRHSRVATTVFHASGPAVPAAARERVEAHARRHGWTLVVLDAGELADIRYRANPVDRCYYCKSNLYARIRALTADPIASGTNQDDLSDYRPGLRAAAEHDVVHPYVEAGIDKAAIYAIAASLGLDDLAQLPAQPCLASRVETNLAIVPEDLAFIDAVEARLAARLGRERIIRCRVTHGGIVIELEEASPPAATAVAHEIARDACRAASRPFAGVRAYRRGAAFLGSPRPARNVLAAADD